MALPTVYFSESKGRHIPISEMEVHHLQNSILRLQKVAAEGQYIDNDLLTALIQEKDRRAVASVSTPAALGLTVAQMLSVLTESPSEAQIRAVLLEVETLATKLKQILGVPVEKEAAPASPENPTPLEDVRDDDISAITFSSSKLSNSVIIASLRQYGVATVGELATLSVADFAAVRFSTGEHLYHATLSLLERGLNWAETSRLLVRDGAISVHLNPNVAAVSLFIESVNRRVATTLPLIERASRSRDAREEYIDKANKLIESVKSRLANAARAHATYALVRRLVVPSYLETLRVSAPFKAQIQRAVDKLQKRVQSGDTSPQMDSEMMNGFIRA